MKQKITFLLAFVLLSVAITKNASAQILLQEGFEGSAFPPFGTPFGNWTLTGGGANIYFLCPTVTNWSLQASGTTACTNASFPSGGVTSHSGQNAAEFPAYYITPSSVGNLVSPSIYFSSPNTGGVQYVLDFWVYEDPGQYTFGSTSSLNIFLTQNNTTLVPVVGTFNNYPVAGPSVSVTGWQHIIYTIPAGTVISAGSYYVVFQAATPTGGYTYGDFYLDDINLKRLIPCFGNPNSIVTGPSHICPNVSFSLLDSTTAGFSGMSYQWQSRLSGSTNNFTNITGATASQYTSTGITLAMDYRVISQCNTSVLFDTASTHTLGTDSFYVCYCGPATNQGLNTNTSTVAHNDSVGVSGTNLHNVTYTPVPFPNGYASFPPNGHTTATLQAGGTYTISSLLSSTGVHGAAWIDFDHQNGFGNVANEYIGMTGPSSSAVLNGRFTVPQNAALGFTGLRVRTAQSNVNFTAGSSCTPEPNGETEDYLVNIVAAPYNDIGAVAFVQPNNNDLACANTNINIRVAISNMGSLAQTNNFTVQVYYWGPASNATNPLIVQYTGTLAAFSNDVVNVGSINLPLHGNYYLMALTHLNGDQNPSNDTTWMGPITITEVPLAPVMTSDTVCFGNPATMSVTPPVAGNIYNWYSAPGGGTIVYNGTSKTEPSLINSEYYFVSASTPPATATIPGGLPDTLGTEVANGGVYLDIYPTQNITIDNIALRFADTGIHQVNMYYHISQPPAPVSSTPPNAYTSTFITNQSQWTLFNSSIVYVPQSTSPLLHNIPLNFPLYLVNGNNVVYSIYLDYDAAVSNGSPSVSTAAQPATGCNFWYGNSLSSSFNNVISGGVKRFNGRISYHLGGSACESQRIPVDAIIGPKPVVHLPPSSYICWYPQLQLDAGNPGSQYTWVEDGVTLSTNTQQLPIPLSDTGIHKYWVQVSRYCSDTDSTTITIVPPPFATGINYTKAGTAYFFSVSGVRDVLSYYWTFGDGQTSTQATPVHDYGNEDPHHIRLVVYNMCGTDTLNWTVPTLSVPNITGNDNALQLYPNPATNMLTISGNDNMQIKDIVVLNGVGTVVLRTESNKVKTDNIDISKLPAGNYILRANTSEGYFNQMFEVLH